MSEKIDVDKTMESKPFEPYLCMEKVASQILVDQDADETKASSFIADVLLGRGIEHAWLFHRLDGKKQQKELLGILDDPTNEDEIKSLFDLETISDDVKRHYGFPL